jgi:hypothetical protein
MVSKNRSIRPAGRLAVLVAVIAAALMVPASSAMAWTNPGSTDATGRLTISVGQNNWSTVTDLALNLESGSANEGAVEGAEFSETITTLAAGIDISANSLAWTMTGNASSEEVSISGVSLHHFFHGGPLSGVQFDLNGDLSGSYDSQTGDLCFEEAPLTLKNSNSPSWWPNGATARIAGCLTVAGAPEMESD